MSEKSLSKDEQEPSQNLEEAPPFPVDDYMQLSRDLEKHHGVFYKMWSLGQPKFSYKTNTAAVYFDKVGDCIDFLINPDFWAKLTPVQKNFIICHECSHVILNHGIRIKNADPSEFRKLNEAMDIVVNHNLVNGFGFNRAEVDPENKLCWTDTVIGPGIPDDKNFEHYYTLIKNKQEKGGKNQDQQGNPSGNKGQNSGKEQDSNQENEPQLADDHSGLGTHNEDLIKKLNDEVEDETKQDLKGFIEKHFQKEDVEEGGKQAGTSPGGMWKFSTAKRVIKKKWETVIKKWAAKHMKDTEVEQWARTSRRLVMLPNEFCLPSDAEVEDWEKDKIDVNFFSDTSGSCAHFMDRFFAAALSLPEDRFNIKMHCFDTQVYETDLKSKKLYGFGGTSFTCIDTYLRQQIKLGKINKKSYNFIITDGFGNRVNPEDPKKWYWFLSENYRDCIPKECNIFMLKDYE